MPSGFEGSRAEGSGLRVYYEPAPPHQEGERQRRARRDSLMANGRAPEEEEEEEEEEEGEEPAVRA
jgi:hypothetical protein